MTWARLHHHCFLRAVPAGGFLDYPMYGTLLSLKKFADGADHMQYTRTAVRVGKSDVPVNNCGTPRAILPNPGAT